ncbi:MAG TPA: hypothetical protein VKS78_17795 [Roseiarcus sp.]|nr:hypothetical protein [Roseiarcus sp.]
MRKFFAGSLRRPAFATLLAAGGLLAFSATSAEAQFFNFLFSDTLRPGQVERMLEMRGLRPVGPIIRNDQVYIVDVALPSGRQQRLIVDAYDGRILEQFRVAAPPRYYGEAPPAGPPADIGGDMGERASPAPSGGPAVVTYGDSMASRGDGYPNVITVPPGVGEDADSKGKAKSLAKHKKIDLTPTASQPPSTTTSPPAPAKPATTQALSGASPAADVKAAAPAATPAPAAAASPAPKASGAGKAINDVPVDPLN